MLLTELISKGGTVMPVILLLSVYVLAVVLYKIYQFWSTGAFSVKFMDSILDAVEHKRISEAMNIAGEQKGPSARVIEAAINAIVNRAISDEKRVRIIESAAVREIRQYENHLRGLEMVANLAPLLGLLGTVTGMVKVFAGISQTASGVDPALLAGGIWEALIATVAGLSVAIPALAAHYMLESRVDAVRANIKDAVMSIMARSGN